MTNSKTKRPSTRTIDKVKKSEQTMRQTKSLMQKIKKLKLNEEIPFAYLQGKASGYFSYILGNDDFEDKVVIAETFLALLGECEEAVSEPVIFVFFEHALEARELKVKHLDKLMNALNDFAIVKNFEEGDFDFVRYIKDQLQIVHDEHIKNKEYEN